MAAWECFAASRSEDAVKVTARISAELWSVRARKCVNLTESVCAPSDHNVQTVDASASSVPSYWHHHFPHRQLSTESLQNFEKMQKKRDKSFFLFSQISNKDQFFSKEMFLTAQVCNSFPLRQGSFCLFASGSAPFRPFRLRSFKTAATDAVNVKKNHLGTCRKRVSAFCESSRE